MTAKLKANWQANIIKKDKKGASKREAQNRVSSKCPKIGPDQLGGVKKQYRLSETGDVGRMSDPEATDAVNFLLAVKRDETTKEITVTGISEECVVLPFDPAEVPPKDAVEIRLWSAGKNSCCIIWVDSIKICVPC